MTDYKNLKLIASSSPHIRSSENTRTIMMDVIIAMIPALIMSVFVFGFRALALTLVSVAACVFWEWGYRKLLKKPQSIGDLSAVVTGMLLAFVCPPELPWWTLVIGAFFSIVVVKQLYGGIGCNFINPALAEAQVHGGMSMGIGYGLSEQLLFDEKTGKPLNNNLLDYKLSTIMDHPHLEAQFVENPEPTSAFGTKALGEPPACSPAPAIRNAIYHATGVAINQAPITPHVLFAKFTEAGLIQD